MYNKDSLKPYSGEYDDQHFEHFLLQFIAVCRAEKWSDEKWGKQLGFFLTGKMKKKYEKLFKSTSLSDYEILFNDLRSYVYGGSFIPDNFNVVQNMQQGPHQAIHAFANKVKKYVDKAYVFVTDETQRNRISVLIFYNGLKPDLQSLIKNAKTSASNIEEAELSVLMAFAQKEKNKEN